MSLAEGKKLRVKMFLVRIIVIALECKYGISLQV